MDYAYTVEVKIPGSKDDYGTEITVVNDTSAYMDYVIFRTRRSKKTIELDDSGVIISEKLAKDLNVKEGDNVLIHDEDNKQATVEVSGVMEMYINNYIFMTSEYYSQVFGYTPDNNRTLASINSDGDDIQSVIRDRYLTDNSQTLILLKLI